MNIWIFFCTFAAENTFNIVFLSFTYEYFGNSSFIQ